LFPFRTFEILLSPCKINYLILRYCRWLVFITKQKKKTEFDTENDWSMCHQTHYDTKKDNSYKKLKREVINYLLLIKHIMTLSMKTITNVFNVLTYIVTSIESCPVGLAVILVLMSVSIFKNAVILYIFWK
jgi:hypothetical protein